MNERMGILYRTGSQNRRTAKIKAARAIAKVVKMAEINQFKRIATYIGFFF
jgi:hypothetical protein